VIINQELIKYSAGKTKKEQEDDEEEFEDDNEDPSWPKDLPVDIPPMTLASKFPGIDENFWHFDVINITDAVHLDQEYERQ
jgi:hypothetical protein